MKTVVSLQDLADQEIHPAALLEEFRRLTERDVSALFSGPLVQVPCPDGHSRVHQVERRLRALCGLCVGVRVPSSRRSRIVGLRSGRTCRAILARPGAACDL